MFNLTEKRHDFSLLNSLIDNFDISPNKNFQIILNVSHIIFFQYINSFRKNFNKEN